MSDRLPRRRVAVFACVLVMEALVTSLLVDVQPLLNAWGFDRLRLFFALPFVVLAAHLILDRSTSTNVVAPWPSTWRFHIFLHAIAFGCFLRVTQWLTAPPLDATVVGALGWLALGVVTVVTLATTVFSITALLTAARRSGRGLGAAVVLGFAAFAAALLTEHAWPLLQSGTLRAVAAILGTILDGVDFEPQSAVVGASGFFVTIDRACSGGEGIGLLLVLVAGYVAMRRSSLRWPTAWLLLPAAILLAGLGNIFRIVALVAIGAKVSPDMALTGFHSKAGWVLACALAFALTSMAERWLTDAPDRRRSTDAAPLYLGPLLVSLAASLVGGLFVVDLDLTYPIRTVIVAAAIVPFIRRRGFERPALIVPVVVGMIVFGLWMWLAETPEPNATSASLATLDALSPWGKSIWIGSRVIGSVIVVPIVEELAFRGFVMRRVVHVEFETVPYDATTILAGVVSSLIFGVLHTSLVAGVIAGLAYAFVAFRGGRLSDAVVAHAVSNGAIAVAVLVGGQWWLWL